MKVLAIIASFVLLTGCTDEDGARKALRDIGLKPVTVGGYAWFSCAGGKGGDTFATRFKAINPLGETVEGAVCSGWLKGKTIRFD